MAWMLGKTRYVRVNRKLPDGGAIGGLPVKERQARRIKRATERAALRRELRSEQ